jgi:glutathionyl-hydroquinone reductase
LRVPVSVLKEKSTNKVVNPENYNVINVFGGCFGGIMTMMEDGRKERDDEFTFKGS